MIQTFFMRFAMLYGTLCLSCHTKSGFTFGFSAWYVIFFFHLNPANDYKYPHTNPTGCLSTQSQRTKTEQITMSKSKLRSRRSHSPAKTEDIQLDEKTKVKEKSGGPAPPAFATLSVADVGGLVKRHPVPFVFLISLLAFMGVEYTIPMIPTASQPLDLGFLVTRSLHAVLVSSPNLNSVLAALNTVSEFI